MTEFKVDTVQMRQCADKLQSLYWKLEKVQYKLAAMQMGSIIQIKASTALIARVQECSIAVGNQSRNLNKLSGALESVATLYKDCEKGLKEPTTAEGAEKKARWDFWDEVIDFAGKLNAPFGIGSAVLNLVMGDAKDKVSGIEGLLDGGADIFKSVVKLSEDADAVWWKEIFGLAATEKKTLGERWDDLLEEYFPGENANAAGKVTTVAKWAGVALSFVGSGIDNYDEFEGDMGSGRYWAETITEGALDVAKGAGIGLLVGTLLGGAPAIVVAGASVAVGWALDAGFKAFTGKDATEWTSDFLLDIGERVIEDVGEGIREAGEAISEGAQQVGKAISQGVEAVWSGICDVSEKLFSW